MVIGNTASQVSSHQDEVCLDILENLSVVVLNYSQSLH